MRLFMFIFDVFFAIAWMAIGIAVLCGYTVPTVTVLCGFLLASLYNTREAIDDWFEWRHRKGHW